MIADTIFHTISYERFSVQGIWHSGSDAVRQILLQKVNIDFGDSIQVDGSGLMKNN